MPESLKIRILCIDDEPEILDMLAMILACEPDFEVKTLADSRRWRAAVEGFRPDVILVDYRMPALRGDELIAELDFSGLRSRVCGVALFSAHLSEREAHEFGADAFFEKPFDLEKLMRVVRTLAPPDQLPCAG